MLLASSICGKQASRGTPYDNTLPVFLALHSHGFALFRGPGGVARLSIFTLTSTLAEFDPMFFGLPLPDAQMRPG